MISEKILDSETVNLLGYISTVSHGLLQPSDGVVDFWVVVG